ncbi:MAG: exo-alpha-sialidase [Bacteroidales bacterium]|nr:exo-alpha-sialidase [Bacteroidales bacterium]
MKIFRLYSLITIACIISSFTAKGGDHDPPGADPGVRKIKDIIIYEDPIFYSSFPSVVRLPSGDYLVAFRRAPDRKIFGENGTSHVDPNSYLMSVKSKDGENWTTEPQLIYAHPFGGSQDPCLLELRDGTLLCTSYGWAFVREDGLPNLKKPYADAGGAIFLGGYLLRSSDFGKSWQGPLYPPHITPEIYFNALGDPIPAFNRGALYEAADGRILWVVAAGDTSDRSSTHLLISSDKGMTWKYSCPVAADPKVTFNETSVYETPKGDIVAFLRTADYDDMACIARSTDGGKSFTGWKSMGFQGHPLNAIRLPDNRVLLTYGYRHKPFGIRARILNPECTDFATAQEIVLREDGGNSDIGYSWPVLMDGNRVLVTYYFNKENGTRHIAGTILEIK